MATLLWSACQKEALPEPANPTAAQEDLTPRIAAFVARAAHQASTQGTSRSTNAFNADSAAWYVEGALNYSLAKAWLPYNELVTDSLSIVVASANGTVNETDAANAYASIFNQLEQAIAAEQHLVVVDASPHGTAEGIELKVRYALGQGNDRLALNTYYPPNTSLFFMSGAGITSCNPDVPSAYAADKTIQNRVSATIPHLAIGQYYASVETWFVDGYGPTNVPQRHFNTEDFQNTGNTSGHFNQNYKIYFCYDGGCTNCLNASDMTCHTQGTYDVMQLINQQYCATKSPASIVVYGDFPVGAGPYIHSVEYTFAKPQYRRN